MPQHDWIKLNEEIKNLEVLPFEKPVDGTVNVAESFYTIQGEGRHTGTPAVFLRVQGCNLLCKWPCDTIPVWRKGTRYTYEQLFTEWADRGFISALYSGAHLILTGGEPLLRQNELIGFMKYLEETEGLTSMKDEEGFSSLYVEVETNGTIAPSQEFAKWINYWNVSPKLSNSSMAESRRIKSKAIQFFNEEATRDRACFKFVIDTPADVKEMEDSYIVGEGINQANTYLMPECVNGPELASKMQSVAELCKKGGYKFGNRLQIQIWNETTGV